VVVDVVIVGLVLCALVVETSNASTTCTVVNVAGDDENNDENESDNDSNFMMKVDRKWCPLVAFPLKIEVDEEEDEGITSNLKDLLLLLLRKNAEFIVMTSRVIDR
jgi:hypothetical protein